MDYRVGIIGAGKMASGYDEPNSKAILSHAHAISENPHLTLAGFYDVDSHSGTTAADKWKSDYYDSLETLVESSDIICIASPDEYHTDYLAKLVDYDGIKAIICEKPLALYPAAAEKALKLYEHTSVPVFVNYSRRFMDGFKTVRSVICDYGGFLSGTCYYGKGLIHNGSHMINLLDYLLGLDDYEVTFKGLTICDFTQDDPSISFVLSDGVHEISFGFVPCDISTVFQTELFFERGKVVYNDATETIELYGLGKSAFFAGYTNYVKTDILSTGRFSALTNLYDEVIACINGEKSPSSDAASAYQTLRKCYEVRNYMRN